MRPWVAPFGNSTLAVFLCLAIGLFLAGALELLVEGTLADAAAIVGDVAEPFDLISVEITGEDKTDKGAAIAFSSFRSMGMINLVVASNTAVTSTRSRAPGRRRAADRECPCPPCILQRAGGVKPRPGVGIEEKWRNNPVR